MPLPDARLAVYRTQPSSGSSGAGQTLGTRVGGALDPLTLDSCGEGLSNIIVSLDASDTRKGDFRHQHL